MSIKDYFKVALKNVSREKKNIFYIVIMVICTVLALGSLIFHTNFINYMNTSYVKNIGFRTLYVMPKIELEDGGQSELLKIDYVDDVYDSKYNSKLTISDFENDNLDGKVEFLYGSIKALPNIIEGRIFEEGETNVAICPIKFYPDSSVYNLKINEEYMLDGSKLLNESFIVKYDTFIFNGDGERIKGRELTRSFKIVGLYDNEQVMVFNNQCYVPDDDIKEMIDVDANSSDSEMSFFAFSLVVDDLSNVQFVMDKIIELGFKDVSVKNVVDANFIRIILITCNAILIVAMFTIILLTSSYIKKKVLNEKKIIGILRTSGYKKNTIKKIYLLEIILTNIFSYIIGITIFLIVYFILKNTIFYKFTYLGLYVSLNSLSILFSLIIIILIPTIITYYYINKKSKLDIVNLIGSEE